MFGHVFLAMVLNDADEWTRMTRRSVIIQPANLYPVVTGLFFFACDNGLSNHLLVGSLLKVSTFDIKEALNKGFVVDWFLACCDYTFTADQWSIIQIRLGRKDCRLLRLESNKVGPHAIWRRRSRNVKNNCLILGWRVDEETSKKNQILNYNEMTMPCKLYVGLAADQSGINPILCRPGLGFFGE